MATLISKDPKIAETSKKLVALLEGITQAGKEFSATNVKLMPESAQKISDSVDKLSKTINQQTQPDYTPHFQALHTQLVKLNTTVSKLTSPVPIPAPAPTAPPSPKKLSLHDYVGSDLDTAPDKTQYVGYVAPNGNWYIVHSDEKNNTMRYHFGTKNYATNWGERYSLKYKILSEATRGV